MDEQTDRQQKGRKYREKDEHVCHTCCLRTLWVVDLSVCVTCCFIEANALESCCL